MVALSSQKLANEIYTSMSEDRKSIAQETITRLLDDEQCQKEMLWAILEYRIRLNTVNRKKIYDWIKSTMTIEWFYDGGTNQAGEKRSLFDKIRKRYKITVTFDEFLTAISDMGDEKELDIRGSNEKKLMKKFFNDYKDIIPDVCNYYYRSTLDDERKKLLVMDLFFWKYLPWTLLHKEEKIAMNKHIQFRAKAYPRRVLKLAKKHPNITLSDQVKLSLFCDLAKINSDKEYSKYRELDFGPYIDKDIVVSDKDFQNLAANNIDMLYQIIQVPQIKISIFIKPKKFKYYYYNWVYKLICIQYDGYIPTKKEAFELLKFFLWEHKKYYFVPVWNALPEKVRPEPTNLCILANSKSCEEPEFNILELLLGNKLVVLDDALIQRLSDLHAKKFKQHRIEDITKLNIPRANDLALQIKKQKTMAFLEV